MPYSRPSRRDDFEVAIICALPLEYDAVCYVFDEFWDDDGDHYGRAPGDPNYYTTGRVGKYNVVLALLPQMGKVNAASAAASMRSSYCGVRLALLVGICGGLPFAGHGEILLGDVVISKTVIQYDFGRLYPDKFSTKSTTEHNLGRPSKDVRSLVATFETDRGREQLEQLSAHFLEQLRGQAAQKNRQGKYDYPGTALDRLFEASYRHKHHATAECVCRDCHNDSDPVCDKVLSSSCDDLGCSDHHLVVRNRLQKRRQSTSNDSKTTPHITLHVGAIASTDMVIKSATDRDKISKLTGAIAFEMEGAGIWDEVPCIVVKGVCDYADSHKAKGWQNYAAATATSAAKAILKRSIQTDKVQKECVSSWHYTSIEILDNADSNQDTPTVQPQSSRAFSTIPFPPDPNFVERVKISSWITDRVAYPGGRAALVGLGGMG
ncbi:kinesin light chain [Fusarium albosuccineum]|uniref:Kinesin light chain n=1 Tax=Fusarium albosuccineum TaxID=1237068 RepID=A0A8H4P219_9HYPO|nr:kinesin light chain [Fusarium albosuccineum]